MSPCPTVQTLIDLQNEIYGKFYVYKNNHYNRFKDYTDLLSKKFDFLSFDNLEEQGKSLQSRKDYLLSKYKKIKEKDELEGKDLNTLKRIKTECHEHRLNYPRLRRKIEKYQKKIENNPN